ncbi:glycosyltransferase family 2 protein [Palleronia abyssalis]|uniref:Cellulose synthase catalytic subunit [UDP-forming] n=1 Tax=Palleronia abyssalis TaxID=1501240 RepID=A0A2R8C0Q6_9RHOB|nr:cellulose synthase catalytic subunit [Palleronia abyssalis]SPJ25972.1 Cellulose synthase catalytic subunit [UDP-forming] [Palleronia abyssalis]
MPLPVWLSETQSSALQMLLVLGLALVLPGVVNRFDTRHRAILMGIGILLALRYAWWRATDTLAPLGLTVDCLASWSLFALEIGTLASSISASVLMSRFRARSGEASRNAGWWEPGPAPRVAVLIATYNEDREVLERSIIGALALDWPSLEVCVLDDGRRDWLRELCRAHGARHMTRPDNKGAKAGNINHALAQFAAEGAPEFFAVLDADFVPHRDFLRRTLALFHDPATGLVQTPQHFFNADPIQHNLGLTRSYPDEQRFFFDHMQPARDAWGLTICCGTSSVARWSAVAELGGLPTDSITEDFLLSLALQERGWETHYLNEPLTEGLAPEGLKEYITQRARWCLGLMQIARGRLGPFAANGLRLRDRWSVIDSVFYWLTTFPFRIAAFVYPLLYWFFNITVVDAEVPEVLSYFGVYFLWTVVSFNLLSPGMLVPLLKDVSQHLGAPQISRAAITGLLKPHGHPFSVTAKGGDRSRLQIQWRLMAPYIVLLVLTLTGLCLGIVSDRFAYYDAGDGKAVILFWTVYNLFVLALVLIACVELPRRERHVADAPARAIFAVEGEMPRRVWVASLSQDTARIRGWAWETGTRGTLRLPGVGDIEASVMAQTSGGVRLRLVADAVAGPALLRRLYAEGDAPGIVETKLSAIVRDLARRLTFGRSV